MFDNIENLKIISSLHRKNKTSNTITNRSANAFIIRVKGAVFYDFYDKTVLAKEGDIIFLPKGVSYFYKCLNEDSLYTSINFECDFESVPHPVCYSFDNFYNSDRINYHFADMWNLGTMADKYKCLSLLYELFSYLSVLENSGYSEKKKFHIIDPAVKYLKEHIYDSSLKVDMLHYLCGISNTYFRRIFASKFGKSPQDYIISKRLSHAKTIFDSGDFDTVKEVALSVGYTDPLYFSKAFKKMYGESPINMDD